MLLERKNAVIYGGGGSIGSAVARVMHIAFGEPGEKVAKETVQHRRDLAGSGRQDERRPSTG